MESCTGGGISNAITNIPDASKVIKFSAITYSNEFKIKMGVPESIINQYTVYSKEVAREMAKTICVYTASNYGVGVTGKLKKSDPNNPFGDDDVVYLSIYDSDNKENYDIKINLTCDTRRDNKEEIMHYFVNKMLEILKKQ